MGGYGRLLIGGGAEDESPTTKRRQREQPSVGKWQRGDPSYARYVESERNMVCWGNKSLTPGFARVSSHPAQDSHTTTHLKNDLNHGHTSTKAQFRPGIISPAMSAVQ